MLGKIYRYILENGTVIKVQFTPGYFHHLLGLQKLSDIPLVTKSPRNKPTYIYRGILSGVINLEDIQKSNYFHEIESRLKHFPQINRLIEFEKIIVDFDPNLINSKLTKANYVLFKRSNDNMYLNLFLMTDNVSPDMQIPLTFLPDMTDYYTYGQRVMRIMSMTEIVRNMKWNR